MTYRKQMVTVLEPWSGVFVLYVLKIPHFVVRDDPKLPDGSGKVLKLNGVVGGLIPGYEIDSLLDGKLVRWSNASYIPKEVEKNMP